MTTLGMFVKQPLPGQVKTRLAAALGAERAADIYAAFIADLAARFRQTADRRVLGFAPQTEEARTHFETIATGDYDLWPQPDSSLGERMTRFFAEHLIRPGDRVVLIGSDSPTLPREFVELAFLLLANVDCVLGPALDGGYYLVGLSTLIPTLFDRIEWSSAAVLQQTIERLREGEWRLALLPPWYDVDTPADWQLLAGHVAALDLAGTPPDFPATRPLLWHTADSARAV